MTSRQEDGYSKPLPSRIRAILDKKKMSRKDLADAVGVSRQRIGYYCDGSNVPDAETLGKIAKALDVSADYLLGLSDNDRQSTSKKLVTYADIAEAIDSIINTTGWEVYVQDHSYEGSESYSIEILTSDDSTLVRYYTMISDTQKALKDADPTLRNEIISALQSKLRLTLVDKKIDPFADIPWEAMDKGFPDDDQLPF